MASSEESFVNKLVIQVQRGRWEMYRLIASRETLGKLVAQLSAALERPEAELRPTFLPSSAPTPLMKEYATRAQERTDRVQFEVAVAEDLAPYHDLTKPRKARDYALIALAIFLGVSALLGWYVMGVYVLKAVDWLLFSHHRV